MRFTTFLRLSNRHRPAPSWSALLSQLFLYKSPVLWLATFLSLIVDVECPGVATSTRTALAISGQRPLMVLVRCFLYLWSMNTTPTALSFDRPHHDVPSSPLWFATKARARIQVMAHQRNLIRTHNAVH